MFTFVQIIDKMKAISPFLFIGIFCFSMIAHAQNYVKTYTGTGYPGLLNGALAIAKFNAPFGMCMDKNRNIYVADKDNNCIRKISADGIVSTYAGAKTAGYVDGPAADARFKEPASMCVDSIGNLYVCDFGNHRIRKITPDGMVSTIAGSGVGGYANGQGTAAKFNCPRGICRDNKGNLYIGDSWNHRIRKITPDGMVSTYAGGGDTIGVQSVGHYRDAPDTLARFYTPCEVKIDAQKNIYVADAYTHRIRKIDSNRVVSTVAGSGFIGQQTGGFEDGAANQARFNVPTSVFVAHDGALYVGDGINQRVRKISNGTVSTFAGTGNSGFEDGIDTAASFDFPRAVVEDASLGLFYVIDYNNHAIRSIGAQNTTKVNKLAVTTLEVWPNPVQKTLNIRGLETGNNELLLTDIAGKTFLQKQVQANEISVNLPELPKGLYVLKVIHAQAVSTVKILVD